MSDEVIVDAGELVDICAELEEVQRLLDEDRVPSRALMSDDRDLYGKSWTGQAAAKVSWACELLIEFADVGDPLEADTSYVSDPAWAAAEFESLATWLEEIDEIVGEDYGPSRQAAIRQATAWCETLHAALSS